MNRKKLEKPIISCEEKFPPVVYGLDGVCKLFNLKNKSTASKLCRTTIKDACAKRGHIIIVDTKKAFELFGMREPSNLVKSSSDECGQ